MVSSLKLNTSVIRIRWMQRFQKIAKQKLFAHHQRQRALGRAIANCVLPVERKLHNQDYVTKPRQDNRQCNQKQHLKKRLLSEKYKSNVANRKMIKTNSETRNLQQHLKQLICERQRAKQYGVVAYHKFCEKKHEKGDLSESENDESIDEDCYSCDGSYDVYWNEFKQIDEYDEYNEYDD
ncbi:hypothetical protein M3Y98_00780100 [Aphelenchoides besseyi]|nr:hypothetical protein M3Y98_00780100 [Aphelenchoides besseyi]KAI6211828.1 hypothetical protein M3Y96_00475700 [Aphelenchoides besseyi]